MVLTATLATVSIGIREGYGAPTVFPRGVTVHDKSKAYQGYTLYCVEKGNRALVVDMEGNVVHSWDFPSLSSPVKPLPRGHIMVLQSTDGKHSDRLRKYDWDGNMVWEFALPGGFYSFHHDFNQLSNGNIMVLTTKLRTLPEFIPHQVKDNIILEIDPTGSIVWQWSTLEHYHQLGISDEGKALIASQSKWDVFHTNSIRTLPVNRFGASDKRFGPGNIIVSQRNTNIVFIIEKATGDIVWKMQETVGQHHASMIQPGLPGSGNIILFDNGGYGGYPEIQRSFSRILEIHPVKERTVWKYEATDNNRVPESFFSRFRSGVQRLPNGNTLITETNYGRVFEVGADKKIVWEFINPVNKKGGEGGYENKVYRAYRVDSTWPTGATGPGPRPFMW